MRKLVAIVLMVTMVMFTFGTAQATARKDNEEIVITREMKTYVNEFMEDEVYGDKRVSWTYACEVIYNELGYAPKNIDELAKMEFSAVLYENDKDIIKAEYRLVKVREEALRCGVIMVKLYLRDNMIRTYYAEIVDM